MQTLNIDAARKLGQDQQNNDTLETPAPPAGDTGTPYSLNTPDILNSLISITTNPFFDNIPLTSTSATSTNTNTDSTAENAGGGPIESTTAAAPNNNGTGAANVNTGTTAYESEDLKVFATLEAASAPSTTTGTIGSTGPPPLINIMPPLRPTSVQSMTSQLIKDSLKHTIQSKRKSSGKEDLDIKAELSKAKIKKREEVRSSSSSIPSPFWFPVITANASCANNRFFFNTNRPSIISAAAATAVATDNNNSSSESKVPFLYLK